MAVVLNRPQGHAVTLDQANNTYQLSDFAANNVPVNSDPSIANNSETVTGVIISKIIFSGVWTISRGANVVWTTSNNTQQLDLQAHGAAITLYANSTLSVNTAGPGTISLVLGKYSTLPAPTY